MLSCGALLAWTKLARTARVSSSCLSVRTHEEFNHTAATCLTTPIVVLHFVTRMRTSLSSFTCASPTFWAPDSIVRNAQALQRRMERPAGKNDRMRLHASGLHKKPPRTIQPCSPVQCRTGQHITSTTAFGQYRPHGKTQCQRPSGSVPQRPP